MQSQVIRQGPDHVYVNICANTRGDDAAHSPAGIHQAQWARSSITRAQAILDNPGEYYMSIIRFRVPTQFIPIGATPGYGGTDSPPTVRLRDSLAWAVTIDYNNQATLADAAHLQWSFEYSAQAFQDIGIAIPPATAPLDPRYIPITDHNAPYFWAFSYQHYVDMLNAALLAAFTTASAFPGWPAGATAAPYIVLNPLTQYMTLYAQTAYVSTAATPIKIYFNSSLMEGCFGRSWRSIFNGLFQSVGEKNYWLQVLDYKGSNSVTLIGGAGAGYAMSQEFQALVGLSNFETIAFQSQSLPVLPSFGFPATPVGGTFPGGPGTQSVSGTPPLIPLISDFTPVSDVGWDTRLYVDYIPSAEYRLIDMGSSAPVYTVDLTVFWSDQLGNYYPLLIPYGACVSAKILFRRKIPTQVPRGLVAREAPEAKTERAADALVLGGARVPLEVAESLIDDVSGGRRAPSKSRRRLPGRR